MGEVPTKRLGLSQTEFDHKYPALAHGILGLQVGTILALWMAAPRPLWKQLAHQATVRAASGSGVHPPDLLLLIFCLSWLSLPLLLIRRDISSGLTVPVGGGAAALFLAVVIDSNPSDLFAPHDEVFILAAAIGGAALGFLLGFKLAPPVWQRNLRSITADSPSPAKDPDLKREELRTEEFLESSSVEPREEIKCPTLITMVHGTFARESKWSKTLCEAIKRHEKKHHLDFQFLEDFRWSGNNSHSERIAGAELLVAHLRRCSGLPGRHVLIAHSHGGTVVSYALRKLNDSERNQIAGVVFLATPFLLVRQRSTGKAFRKAKTIVAVLGGFAALWLSGLGLVREMGRLWEFAHLDGDPSSIVLFFGIIASFVAPIIFGEAVKDFFHARQGLAPPSLMAATLDSSDLAPVPAFCVYDDRDEARRWLNFLNWLAIRPAILIEKIPIKYLFLASLIMVFAGGYLSHVWPSILTEERDATNADDFPAISGTIALSKVIWGFVLTRVVANGLDAAICAGLISALAFAVVGLIVLAIFALAQKLLVGSPFCVGSLSLSDFDTSAQLCVRVLRHPRNARKVQCQVEALRLTGSGSFLSLYHCSIHEEPEALAKIIEWIWERATVAQG